MLGQAIMGPTDKLGWLLWLIRKDHLKLAYHFKVKWKVTHLIYSCENKPETKVEV